jgi:hypothetical protein
MRFEQYILNEARGIRADKIGKVFKFVGIGKLRGDERNYVLQNIEDVSIDVYESVIKKYYNVVEANQPNPKNQYATFFSFTLEKKNTPLTIVRFFDKITNVQSKHIGMKLTTSSESFKMKPQDFKIPYKMDYKSYVNHIRMMINILYRNDELMVNYLNFLIDYVESNGKTKQRIDTSTLPINQIGKNFGEILGPIALFNDNKLFSVKFDKNKDFVIMPTAGNEKLLDYIIEKNNGIEYKFSAKYNKGAASSLSSIYDIIQNNKQKFLKFTKEIYVLDVIMNNTSIEAPVILCKEWGFINDEQWKAWQNKEWNLQIWDKLKNTKQPKAKNPEKASEKPWWILSIMAYMSADYMNSSKFNFKDLIISAMNIVAVTQINMYISSSGIPSFKANETSLVNNIKVVVDAKKGYFSTDRPKQRLSFKIK